MAAPTLKRRWSQFSLLTLLVVVTLCAIACGWLAVKMRQAEREAVAAAETAKRQRQQDAAAALQKVGAKVTWSHPLATYAGKEFPVSVIAVCTVHIPDLDIPWHPTDADLKYLKEFSELRELDLNGAEKVTSVGLENLKELRKLQELDLTSVNVTDNDLKLIGGLKELRILRLNENYGITDAGLQNLKSLSQLELLEIGPACTKEGIRSLQQALPKCKIRDYRPTADVH